jgi:hypothetical protein
MARRRKAAKKRSSTRKKSSGFLGWEIGGAVVVAGLLAFVLSGYAGALNVAPSGGSSP